MSETIHPQRAIGYLEALFEEQALPGLRAIVDLIEEQAREIAELKKWSNELQGRLTAREEVVRETYTYSLPPELRPIAEVGLYFLAGGSYEKSDKIRDWINAQVLPSEPTTEPLPVPLTEQAPF